MTGCQRQDRRQLAVELGLDLAAHGAGCQDDLLDQGTHGLGRFARVVGTGERVFEALDRGAVDLGDVGVNAWQRRWGFGEAGFDLVLLALQLVEPVEHGPLVAAVLDRIEDAFDTAIYLGERCLILGGRQLAIMVKRVGLLLEGLDELGDKIWRYVLVLEARDDACLECLALDCPALGS